MKWFLLVYTVLWYAAVLVRFVHGSLYLPEKRDLLAWSLGITGLVFFVDVHVLLEIPGSDNFFAWIIYTLVLLWLGLVGIATITNVSVILCGVGLIILLNRVVWALPL